MCCTDCGKFVEQRQSRFGRCDACYRRMHRKLNKAKLNKKERAIRLRKYGLTPITWEALKKRQDNKCRICLEQFTGQICVDHDHITRRTRGLLCRTCNLILGYAKDNPFILSRSIAYLAHFKAIDAYMDCTFKDLMPIKGKIHVDVSPRNAPEV